MIANGQARVLGVSKDGVRDITRAYQIVLHADPRATRIDALDAGDPNAAASFGPTWFPPKADSVGCRNRPRSACPAPRKPPSAST